MEFTIDVSNVNLETERLIIRPLQESDLVDFNEYTKVAGVGEMAGWAHHKSLDESKAILLSMIKEKQVFGLVLKSENKLIGTLGLHPREFKKVVEFTDLKYTELGYVLAKPYWGLGLTKEAAEIVIKYFFDNDILDAVTTMHHVENTQSKRVIEKLGFTYVGNEVYYHPFLDEYRVSKCYIKFK